MNAIQDGGPAFPFSRPEMLAAGGNVIRPRDEYDGMSLRDYFAAHAPEEPQAWFEPVMTMPEPEPVYSCSGSNDHKYRGEFDDHEWCVDTRSSDRHAWRHERNKQRLVQWPYAWATAMLAERERAR